MSIEKEMEQEAKKKEQEAKEKKLQELLAKLTDDDKAYLKNVIPAFETETENKQGLNIKDVAPLGGSFAEAVSGDLQKMGTPAGASEIIGHGVSLPGYAIDAFTATTSPVKLAAKGIAKMAPGIVKNVSNAAGNAAEKIPSFLKPKAKILPVAPAKAAQYTADAAIYNNAYRKYEGEDFSFGASEIIGGIAGAAAGSPMAMTKKMDRIKAENYAARNNRDINFAERYSKQRGGNLKGKAAVGNVINKELRMSESFQDGANRMRKELDKLDKEFYKHFDRIKDQKITIADPAELGKDLNKHVREATSDLGLDWENKVADEIGNVYDNYLRQVLVDRHAKGGMALREDIAARATGIERKQLYEEFAKDRLTIGELDKIKRGMQARTSAYNRGVGTQERMGLESTANKHGSEGILHEFSQMVDADKNLSKESKMAIIEQMEAGVDKMAENIGNIEEAYLATLKKNNIASGADIDRYMKLNKERSNKIGAISIFERAADKERMITGRSAATELWDGAAKYSDVIGSVGRAYGSNADEESRKKVKQLGSEIIGHAVKHRPQRDKTKTGQYDTDQGERKK